MKESTRVLVALGAAIVGGVAIASSHNEALLNASDYLVPIGGLWVNAIRMTVIPLVVSLVIIGIASTDLGAVGKLGTRTIATFFALLIGVALVAVPVAPLLFTLLPDGARPALPPGAAEAAAQLAGDQPQTFAAWLASLLPANPIAAAASGSMVSIVLFALLLALAITRSPDTTRTTLVGFFRAVADAMLVLVRWVVAAAPIGVFALVLPLAARQGASLVGAIGFYIAAYSGGCILFTLLLYPVVAMFGGVPMRVFARAALPAQMIAFSSSSSVASLPALVQCAEQGLGIKTRVSGFVLPLAVTLFKIAAPVAWTIGALFIGWFYHVPLGVTALATVAFAAVFLAFAGPGVPRGAFIMLTPLFVNIGLPAEGIGILIAVDAIPDTFSTVLNVTGDLAATAIVAKREEAAA